MHPVEIAAELGITLKQARILTRSFRVGMSPLARQVMINQSIRDGKLPRLKKSIAEIDGVMPTAPRSIGPYRPRVARTAVKCVACENEAKMEAMRFKRARWESVCFVHRELWERDRRVKFRNLQLSTQQKQSIWNRNSYERHAERRRKEKLAYYHNRKAMNGGVAA